MLAWVLNLGFAASGAEAPPQEAAKVWSRSVLVPTRGQVPEPTST